MPACCAGSSGAGATVRLTGTLLLVISSSCAPTGSAGVAAGSGDFAQPASDDDCNQADQPCRTTHRGTLSRGRNDARQGCHTAGPSSCRKVAVEFRTRRYACVHVSTSAQGAARPRRHRLHGRPRGLPRAGGEYGGRTDALVRRGAPRHCIDQQMAAHAVAAARAGERAAGASPRATPTRTQAGPG